jgi:DNA mismatch repair protein MutS2
VRFEAGGGEGAVLAGLAGGDERVDFHGLRVEQALDQLAAALERGARRGADRVVIVHGIGTGALRRAVRDALRESPYVAEVRRASAQEGGEGATVAVLR